MRKKALILLSIILTAAFQPLAARYAAADGSAPAPSNFPAQQMITTTTTTPGKSSGGDNNQTLMTVGMAVGGVALGLGATYLLGGFGGDACSKLNTEDFSAFAAIKSVKCEISQQNQEWLPANCEATQNTIAKLTTGLKTGVGATADAVVQAGSAGASSATSGGLTAAPQAAAAIYQAAGKNIGKTVADTAAPTAAVAAALADHKAALSTATSMQSQLKADSTTCDQIQVQAVRAASTSSPDAPALQAKVMEAGQTCGVLAPPAPPGQGCEICHAQEAKMGKIIEEQNAMIAALQKAQLDNEKKRAALAACNTKDTKSADASKAQADAYKPDPTDPGTAMSPTEEASSSAAAKAPVVKAPASQPINIPLSEEAPPLTSANFPVEPAVPVAPAAGPFLPAPELIAPPTATGGGIGDGVFSGLGGVVAPGDGQGINIINIDGSLHP